MTLYKLTYSDEGAKSFFIIAASDLEAAISMAMSSDDYTGGQLINVDDNFMDDQEIIAYSQVSIQPSASTQDKIVLSLIIDNLIADMDILRNAFNVFSTYFMQKDFEISRTITHLKNLENEN